MVNKEEIGQNASLFIAGNTAEVPLTSASYTQDADISEVQFNTSLTQSIALTGVSYSGSFSYSGSNEEVYDQLFGEQDQPKSAIPRRVSSLTFEDSERIFTFKNCIVGSRSRDLPADDRTETSYDFTAEELVVIDK